MAIFNSELVVYQGVSDVSFKYERGMRFLQLWLEMPLIGQKVTLLIGMTHEKLHLEA